MRKLYLIAVLLITSVCSYSQFINLPDTNFRNALIPIYPTCFNSAKQLDTSCAKTTTSVIFLDLSQRNIKNIEGIHFFEKIVLLYINNNQIDSVGKLPPNLEDFNCSNNKIVHLPNLQNRIKGLNCANNLISQLPQLNDSLLELNCSKNRLSILPQLPNMLYHLNCEFNLLSQIINLPSNLKHLNVGNNRLSQIPLIPNKIEILIANNNLLTNFPTFSDSSIEKGRVSNLGLSNNFISQLPNNIKITNDFKIDNNPIINLPKVLYVGEKFNCSSTLISKLPDSLDVNRLFCNNTKIDSIPIHLFNINRILTIDCQNTKITNFNFIKKLKKLESIDMSNNFIDSIPDIVNDSKLTVMTLKGVRNLSCLPVFNSNNLFIRVRLDSGMINCTNKLSRTVIYDNASRPDSIFSTTILGSAYEYIYPKRLTLPLCNPTNNINNCQSNPPISSNIYYDYNNNNTKDANEPFATNIGVRLTNVNRTTTNANGAFTIYADTIGTQTVTITAPRFYSAVPNNINVNLTRYDTSVSLPNIALQLTTLKDSLSTKITPINWAARPGFVYPYLVHYKNVGSTTINATASLQYNNALLNYDSSSNSAVTNTGAQLNLALNSFMPGQEASYVAYFRVKPSGSLLGQVLNAYSNIVGGAGTSTDSTRIIIGGSYDPNDKLSTPQLSTTQVAEGQFINYTIRFQNTGTDTAFTVVIADTLNSLLQANTFEFLGSSHACKTTIQDNKLYFEFRNILLPDSNVNLIGSNGFVNFRIKPQSSVVLNTVIPNKGAIYFDYNEPIITNTATTTISNTILPTHLLGFSAALQSNKTVLLYWNTSNEINTQFFVVEQSTNGKDFEPLETVSAKGSGNNSYYINKVYNNLPTELYYRLKTIDKDGSISYSNIIKIKQANATGWSIVTNPAKGKLLIEVKDKSLQNTQARLVNGLGQVLQTITVQQGFNTLNLKNLKAGLYYVQTQNGTKQVVVE